LFGKEAPNNKKNDLNINNADMKSLLGGKGANLEVMSKIGLSVPPGYTITTEVCGSYNENSLKLPPTMWPAAVEGIKFIEQSMGNIFGDEENPLLVSVRSGAAISMPGMMDTVLNLGINDKTVVALAKRFGERFAMDSYRRFLHMFGTVVMDMPHHAFESLFHDVKVKYSIENDNDLEVKHLEEIVEQYKKIYADFGKDFPTDPYDQLLAAIIAVFNSWNSERAVKYRDAEGITGLLGTAVNVQAMVFGNMGSTSGTGVCFTRNPNTGEHKLYGEYLINAQGEDVVAGIRTPEQIEGLATALPEAYEELINNIDT